MFDKRLSKEEMEMLQNACLDDSTKIIRYLEDKECKNRKREIANLVLTIIAAICGILSLLPDMLQFFST